MTAPTMYLYRYRLITGKDGFLISDQASAALAACKEYIPFPDKPDMAGWLIFDAAMSQRFSLEAEGSEEELATLRNHLITITKGGDMATKKTEKKCNGCGETQPVENFYINRGYPRSKCKVCTKAYAARKAVESPEVGSQPTPKVPRFGALVDRLFNLFRKEALK